MAEHLGEAYLRYSFTKGTEQEVGYLAEVLGLAPGQRLLDVGCGPGRHALAVAEQGVVAVGVDISERFVNLAAGSARSGSFFVRGDARRLPLRSGSFDAAWSLCQGGFGLLGGTEDSWVLEEMARCVRPGGHVVVSAFSAYFQVRFLEDGDTFDADQGVNHEHTEVRSPDGEVLAAELWTTCFTPRELRLTARAAGLEPLWVWSVTPGAYAATSPELGQPEFLLVARRP